MTAIKPSTDVGEAAKSPVKDAAEAYERTGNGIHAWEAIYQGIMRDEPLPDILEEYLFGVAVYILQRSKRLRSPLKLQNKKGAAADAAVVRALHLRHRGRSAMRLDPARRKQKAARARVNELMNGGVPQIAARKQVKAAMYPNISDARFRGILNQKD